MKLKGSPKSPLRCRVPCAAPKLRNIFVRPTASHALQPSLREICLRGRRPCFSKASGKFPIHAPEDLDASANDRLASPYVQRVNLPIKALYAMDAPVLGATKKR